MDAAVHARPWQTRPPVDDDAALEARGHEPSATDGCRTDAADDGGERRQSVLVIVDVHLYAMGIERLLEADGRVHVTGVAPDVASALDIVPTLARPPDVALIDLGSPAGPACARSLRAAFPPVAVVALGIRRIVGEVVEWTQAGVVGLVTVDAALDDLVSTIERAGRGHRVCPPELAALLMHFVATEQVTTPTYHAASLTTREREILGLVGIGLSNKEIAERLHLAIPTVKNRVHTLFEKFGVRGRDDLARVLRGDLPAHPRVRV